MNVKTTSVMLQNLCVPCACHCRYCLLSWSGTCVGIDYDRSERLARRFYEWVRVARSDLTYNFAFGYAMEHPRLISALQFLRSIGSVSGEFLQCDGLSFRTDREIEDLMHDLKRVGVRLLNFTFYGVQAYHDRFAGRTGDFDYMIRLVEAAACHGLNVSAGVPLTHENTGQVDELLALLTARIQSISLFIPHAEGRGAALEPIRFTQSDYESLSDQAQSLLNRKRFKTEREWLTSGAFEEPTRRSLLISLTRDNIDRIEQRSFDDTIAQAEALDDTYYGALPSYEALAERYGSFDGEKFYGQRDLFARYQKAYIRDAALSLYDVTDERFTGSRRY